MWSPKPVARRWKALILVPCALASGSLSASGVAAANSARGSLPSPSGGVSVPSRAIEQPATLPVAGEVAPAVPARATDVVPAGPAVGGIPAVALAAYQRAAQAIDGSDPSCNIPWELIAAIGRVESDHGRFGGSALNAQGTAVPGIYGPELNGENGTQLVSDSDRGLLDGDAVYDRAVGPMQFLPSTWRAMPVVGGRNPQNINDAALGAAIYLCSGRANLGTADGQQAAVFRYNHSQQYVDMVLAIMRAYESGDYSAVWAASGTPEAVAVSAAAPPPAAIGSPSASSRSGAATVSGARGFASGRKAPTPSSLPTAPAVLSAVPAALLGAADALALCTTQLSVVPDPLGLLEPLKAQCATKITGLTPAQAQAAMPTTLFGLLAWLKS